MYTRALQGKRVHVSVGEQEKKFTVSKDLLVKCSRTFNKMCTLPFKESVEGIIKFPEVKPETFENFMVWLHSYLPSESIVEDTHAVIDLAIFSATYQIFSLQNKMCDTIQDYMKRGQLSITPEVISLIYSSTPDGSKLRELFCLRFCERHRPVKATDSTWPTEIRQKNISVSELKEWEVVFDDFPNFGRDYFRYTRGSTWLSSNHSCRFHEHRNITIRVQNDLKKCPYLERGDWIENGIGTQKLMEKEPQKEADYKKPVSKFRSIQWEKEEEGQEGEDSFLSAVEVPVEEPLPEQKFLNWSQFVFFLRAQSFEISGPPPSFFLLFLYLFSENAKSSMGYSTMDDCP